MSKKRRSLVLTDESARHPFRMSLPPHIRSGTAIKAPRPSMRSIIVGEWRGFLAAYCATFIVVTVFIA